MGRNSVGVIGSVPVHRLVSHSSGVWTTDALSVTGQGGCYAAVTPDRSRAGRRGQLGGVDRIVVECRFVRRRGHGGHVFSDLVVAGRLRHLENALMGGGHRLGAERGAGSAPCHPVDTARRLTERGGFRGRAHGELLVRGGSCIVDILADYRMHSVRFRNIARGIGSGVGCGDQPFLVTLDLVHGSLDFDFANADIQQPSIDTLQLVQILDISVRTLVFTHGGHVPCSRTSYTLGVHPYMNAEMLAKVVLPGELLAASGALERLLYRVGSNVLLEMLHAFVHSST